MNVIIQQQKSNYNALLRPFNILLAFLALHTTEANQACQVEICIDRHAHTLDHRVILQGSSVEYCQVLSDYMECLRTNQRACHSLLHFHSASTAAHQHWTRFGCSHFTPDQLLKASFSGDAARCPFWEENESLPHQLCFLFGALYLHPFAATEQPIQTCSFEGARPLVDNRFLVVQLTASPLPSSPDQSSLVAGFYLTKITVLIKPFADCIKEQKVYETSSWGEDMDTSLPTAFTDGTTQLIIGDGARDDQSHNPQKIVEVSAQSPSHIHIHLHFLRTTISIRRQAAHLSVSILAPPRLLHSHYEGMASRQLCLAERDKKTCSSGAREFAAPHLPVSTHLHALLGQPQLYSKCVLRQIPPSSLQIQKQLAVDSCSAAKVFDQFFDLCVYDLLMRQPKYSDESIPIFISSLQIAQQEKAQWMLRVTNQSFSSSSPSSHRQSLRLYESNAQLKELLETECLRTFPNGSMSTLINYWLLLTTVVIIVQIYI